MFDFALHEKLGVVQLFTKLLLDILIPVYFIRHQHKLTYEKLTHFTTIVFA